MTDVDIPAGMRLCQAAGWNQLADDWLVFLDSPGSGAFLVETRKRVVGTSAYIRYGSFGWIAMMLVDPDERRSGIGSRLMQAALSALDDAACVGLDATPLGEPLYRRFGLVNDYQLVRAKTVVGAGRFERAADARPMTLQDLPRILPRDREVFGADRSRLITYLFNRSPECAWIANEAYCFGRPGRLFNQLGPVVAEDREAARRVVSACLSNLEGKAFAIDVPLHDAAWLSWLQAAGFAVERPFVRMFKEGHKHPGIPALQYAITGPEFA